MHRYRLLAFFCILFYLWHWKSATNWINRISYIKARSSPSIISVLHFIPNEAVLSGYNRFRLLFLFIVLWIFVLFSVFINVDTFFNSKWHLKFMWVRITLLIQDRWSQNQCMNSYDFLLHFLIFFIAVCCCFWNFRNYMCLRLRCKQFTISWYWFDGL